MGNKDIQTKMENEAVMLDFCKNPNRPFCANDTGMSSGLERVQNLMSGRVPSTKGANALDKRSSSGLSAHAQEKFKVGSKGASFLKRQLSTLKPVAVEMCDSKIQFFSSDDFF